jgi:hypothetical protein
MVTDAKALQSDSLQCDVCIVGAGPAGITLATLLAEKGYKVIVAESGGKYAEVASNQLNTAKYTSNFTFRENFANRHRQIGGTANLWAGRVVPFKFSNELDEEWGAFPSKLEPFKSKVNAIVGLSNAFVTDYQANEHEVVAFWGKKTERFNLRSAHTKSSKYDIIFHLTFTGKVSVKVGDFEKFTFHDANKKPVEIEAKRFILATGGIENSRLLLLMEETLKPLMGINFFNVGKYIMDHPKVTHGDVLFKELPEALEKFKLRIVKEGKVKYGIKISHHQTGVRAYANLVETQPDFVSKSYAKLANIYKKLTNKVYHDAGAKNQKTQLIDDLIYLLEPEELIPHDLLYQLSKVKFSSGGGSQKFKVISYLEQLPEKDNEIVLNRDLLDKNGLPTPELKLKLSEKELAAVIHLYQHLHEYISSMGGKLDYQESYLSDAEHYTDSAHHMGGTRYAKDLRKAVVDDTLKVIGCENLYVVGSSVFPTSSVENPTHLIVNLACYLSSVIIKSSNKEYEGYIHI